MCVQTICTPLIEAGPQHAGEENDGDRRRDDGVDRLDRDIHRAAHFVHLPPRPEQITMVRVWASVWCVCGQVLPPTSS